MFSLPSAGSETARELRKSNFCMVRAYRAYMCVWDINRFLQCTSVLAKKEFVNREILVNREKKMVSVNISEGRLSYRTRKFNFCEL